MEVLSFVRNTNDRVKRGNARMSDLINGREMLMRLKKDLCYGIACKECSMCTEDGGCRVEEWIDKFPSADRPQLAKDIVEPISNGNVIMSEDTYEDLLDRPQEWIPCSERLPNESDYYFVTLRGEFNEIEPCVVWFAHEDDYDCDSEWREITDSDTVLAWMPLPKPWKGADDE